MYRPGIKAVPSVSSPLTSVRHKRTLQRRVLGAFLGPKNFKGLYSKNPLAFTPNYWKYDKTKNYITSYPVRASNIYEKVKVQWKNVFNDNRGGRYVDSLSPFPENEFCKSALMIPNSMRNKIVEEHEAGETVQKLSFKYGLALPRVEALINLRRVEKKLEREVSDLEWTDFS
jgi:Eukaryotic mitochondrial regulator protein